ncbi:MAG: hypothetical protein EPN33_11625 [Acidobacteria bacterium]|nr:MAG: hypothetical protein EPN33_11625 [Acidobacteriota bacterium]
MAELTAAAPLRLQDQLRAILGVRWQLMMNGMRTTRGALEAISHAWAGIWFTILGVGGAIGFAIGGWHFVHNGEAIWLGMLLWPLFLFWQIFPLAATAFADHPDLSHLTRYPLNFRAYSFVRVLYGSFDVANLVGALCTLGLMIGVTIARPRLAAPAILAGLLYVAFNLLLTQMIAAWLERWLAKRRTREMLAVVFFIVIIGIDFLGPITHRLRTNAAAAAHLPLFVPLASWLPPGLPAKVLAAGTAGHVLLSIGALVLLAVCAAIVLKLLNLRLHAEYAGEVISEAVPNAPAPRRPMAPALPERVRVRWPCGDTPAMAVASKEYDYMRRSPYVFFALAMPLALMVLFMLGGSSGARSDQFWSTYAFPFGLAYAVMTLMNLVYNVCGADAGGVQLYFMAPVRFGEILAGKNLVYAVLLAIEGVLLYIVARLLHYRPTAFMLTAAVLGYVFLAICSFTAGNLVSLYLPKKMDIGRMGRHAARGVSSMMAMAIEAVAIALVVLAVVVAKGLRQPEVGLLALVILTVLAAMAYRQVLEQTDHIALARRETLITELTKT